MAYTGNTDLRVMVRGIIREEGGEAELSVVERPHNSPGTGGPPEEMHHQGAKQVIIIYEDRTLIYRWAEFELIPDPELLS